MSTSHTDRTIDSSNEKNSGSLHSTNSVHQEKKGNPSKNPLKSRLNLGSKLKTIFTKKLKVPENYKDEILSDHLSNTLGIINLLSADQLNAEQTAYIASLKSSCDFLFEKLSLPYPENYGHASNEEIEIEPTKSADVKSILLVCSHPLQKKILKNLIEKWGYQIQIISSLPQYMDLFSSMNYNLVIIAHREENICEAQIQALNMIDQDFLVLTSGINSIRSKHKQFPVIKGPIDPDFLSYKMNKIIKSRQQKEKII